MNVLLIATMLVGGALVVAPGSASAIVPMVAPTIDSVVLIGGKVTITFTDRSTNEQVFEVNRKGVNGAYTYLSEMFPVDEAGTGRKLTLVDSAPTTAPQCYVALASNISGTNMAISLTACVGGGGDISGPLIRPDAPTLQTAARSVQVYWLDNTNNELSFAVEKRDVWGNWVSVYQTPTRSTANVAADVYSWVDNDTSMSGQCYRIVNKNNVSPNFSMPSCTVRPDPNRFPQTVPPSVLEWTGLPTNNDGVNYMFNSVEMAYLMYTPKTLGVDLDFDSDSSQSVWKIEGQAFGDLQLMKGQAVALRAWGGGWLHTGSPTFGIGLDLDMNTPRYEWYVLDGNPFNVGGKIEGTYALWNSVRQDFLIVPGNESAGPGLVNLIWYKDWHPSTPPSPTGIRMYQMFNCAPGGHDVTVWVRDATIGEPFKNMAGKQFQGDTGGCPAAGRSPFTFDPPAHNHLYQVVATDPTMVGCTGGSPDSSACQAMFSQFVSDRNVLFSPTRWEGVIRTDTVGLPSRIAACTLAVCGTPPQ
jgi:hypothetical protein